MNSKNRANVLAAVVGIVALGVMAAAIIVVPSMQAPHIQVNHEARVHLERARRMLAKYDPNLAAESDYRASYGEEGFLLPTDTLDQILQDPDLDVEARTGDELREYAEATGGSPARMTGASMVTRGASEYEKQLQANTRLLSGAQQEINQALNVSYGEVSARQNAGAHRLMGMIHYQQALAHGRKLSLLRHELASQRYTVGQLESQRVARNQDRQLVAASDIEARIRDAQSERKATAGRISEQEGAVAQLQASVEELAEAVERATGRGDAARDAMEILQDLGVDLSNPAGLEEFKKAFGEQAVNYRSSLAKAHVLEHGTLENARIDDTGDYVNGQYVPIQQDGNIELRRGLKHYRQDLERASAELEKMREVEDQLAENIEGLQALKSNLEQRAQIAVAFVEEKREQIAAAYLEFGDLGEDLLAAQEEAIEFFEKAAQSFKSAASGVATEESQARQTKPTNNERLAYHYSAVAADQSQRRGHIIAQRADAELRIGMILLGRYQEAASNIGALGQLDLAQGDKADWNKRSAAAKSAAIERVESAISLLDDDAQDRIGQGNWTVAAEIGAAHYILSLLDVDLAADRALAWYQAALDGRTGEAREHAQMLDFIQARLPSSRE